MYVCVQAAIHDAQEVCEVEVSGVQKGEKLGARN